ncbi:SDR family oxidoreductase [Lusitaniella coriacea]|uniref:SDR family oxidoreductase n=1 Tax=Lusitaniella coriacea TaxID=1983105 RepID=UPI003CFB1307
MKFLIVGASGFIGSYTLHYIRSLGYEVIGTKTNSKQSNLVSFDLFSDRIQDCIDPTFFQTDRPIFGIIFSAFSRIDQCFLEQDKSSKINVKNTCRLLDDFKHLGIKPIFLSSDHVYNGTLGYYSEADTPNPINEYGRQKLAVENYIQKIFTDNFLVFRLSKIFGDNPKEAHPFSDWYQKIRNKQPIVCIQGQIFSPTFVEDVAKGIVLSCQRNLSGIYHLANPQFFPREELARQFARSLGQEVEVVSKAQEEFGFADKRPEKTYLDSTQFIRETGMSFTSMREVFETFVQNLETDCSETIR